MKDTAPISLGILAVAAIFGLIGGGVALVLWDFGFIAALMIAAVIALIVMLILWLGWRDPAPTMQESNAAKRAELEASHAKGAAAYGNDANTSAPAPTATAAAPAAVASAGAAAAATTAPAAPKIKPSAELPGEKDLGARKGEWKYEGDGADAKAPAASAPAAAPAPTAAPAHAASADNDYDGDGIIEGANEGSKPETLSGPRGGKADNLKEIKGIGPKLEKLCNALGFYHFDQIAKWSADEVAWVDANLEGFKGRVTRDTWVEQATILAAGGETAFSKKVDKGGVY